MSTRTTIPISLMFLLLFVQLPLPVMAEDAGVLKAETASVDTRTTQSQPAATGSPSAASAAPAENTPSSAEPTTEKTLLYGSARKHDHSLDASAAAESGQNPPQDLNATAKEAQLQAEKSAADAYKLAVEKLTSGQKLSADEYRALGVGCMGFESDRPFFQNIAIVNSVYRGSPAYEAGIRTGDRMVDNADDEDKQAKADPSQPLWSVSFDQAGTSAEVTVLRKGQPVKLTLVRMNIEDIQEDNIRRMWEGVVRRLGYPQGGTFTGKSFHNLSRTR